MFGFGKDRQLAKRELLGRIPDEFALKTEWFELPGFGRILLREMNSGQRDEWEWFLSQRKVVSLSQVQQDFHRVKEEYLPDPRQVKNVLISMCVLDPSTQKLMFEFSDPLIGELPCGIVDRVYDACLALNGLRVRDYADAKKNSAMTATSGDASGLPVEPEKPLSN